ncbi:unnamed protein product [Gongylonema pulchrum]|uniref:Pentatricopeptide repeat-containing protein n=1 Tax=Gongylonema pulchrum TaxID=637853 RepID=A0A183D127_9BILA|nr:unnamed protein product [Gongylonema pulchrum]
MEGSVNREEGTAISGQAIIEAYHSGDVDGAITYGKICKAVDLLSRWQPKAACEFLLQFVDIAYLLDHRCKELVLKFAVCFHVSCDCYSKLRTTIELYIAAVP